MDSEQQGELERGEVFTALETITLDDGTIRLKSNVRPTGFAATPTRSALTFSPADPPAPPNSPTPSPLGQNGWLSLKGHLVERVEDDLGEAMKRRQRVRRIRRAAHVLC
jgi:hypothetical protein